MYGQPCKQCSSSGSETIPTEILWAIQAATSNLGETRGSDDSAGSQCATDPGHRQMTASCRTHPLKLAIDQVLHDQNALGRESWRQLRSHVYYIT